MSIKGEHQTYRVSQTDDGTKSVWSYPGANCSNGVSSALLLQLTLLPRNDPLFQLFRLFSVRRLIANKTYLNHASKITC